MCTRFVFLSALILVAVVGLAISSAENELAATEIQAIRSYDLNVGEDRHLDINRQPLLETDLLGGVSHPTRPQLGQMDAAPYILHATSGKLNKVPAEKVLLPHDNDVTPQSVKRRRGRFISGSITLSVNPLTAAEHGRLTRMATITFSANRTDSPFCPTENGWRCRTISNTGRRWKLSRRPMKGARGKRSVGLSFQNLIT